MEGKRVGVGSKKYKLAAFRLSSGTLWEKGGNTKRVVGVTAAAAVARSLSGRLFRSPVALIGREENRFGGCTRESQPPKRVRVSFT